MELIDTVGIMYSTNQGWIFLIITPREKNEKIMIWWKKNKRQICSTFSTQIPIVFIIHPTIHLVSNCPTYTLPNSYWLNNNSQQFASNQWFKFLIYSNLLVSDMLTIPKVSGILFTIPNVFDILINPKVSNIKIPNIPGFY